MNTVKVFPIRQTSAVLITSPSEAVKYGPPREILINSNAHVFNEIPDKNTEAIYIPKIMTHCRYGKFNLVSQSPLSQIPQGGFLIRHTFRGIGKADLYFPSLAL